MIFTSGRKHIGGYVVVGAVLCLLLFWLGVHRPLQAASQEEWQAAHETSSQAAVIQRDREAHADNGKQDKKLAARQQQADAALPDDLALSRLLADLQQAALQHGVMLTGVSPGKVQREEELLRQPVQVRCEADYFSLLSFLKQLDAEERFLQLEQVKIQSTGGRLSCELTLAAFALPPTAENINQADGN